MTTLRFTTDIGVSIGGRVGRILRVHIGPGAGYIKRIGPFKLRGYTAWIGFNVYGGRWINSNYSMRAFSIGCTGNANRVPHVRY